MLAGAEQPWCVASAVFRLESGHNGPEIACQTSPGRLWTVRMGSFAPSIWEMSVQYARALDRRLPYAPSDPGGRMRLTPSGEGKRRSNASRVGVACRGCMAGTLLVLALTSPARGYVLDDHQDFDFRLRAYTEAAVAAEKSEPQTKPSRVPFQLIEHRASALAVNDRAAHEPACCRDPVRRIE